MCFLPMNGGFFKKLMKQKNQQAWINCYINVSLFRMNFQNAFSSYEFGFAYKLVNFG